jgi:hypothetical protein
MNKWRIKALGYAIGKDNYENWFIQRFQNGSLKTANHSKSLWHCIKSTIL